jgi:hypothetical protein
LGTPTVSDNCALAGTSAVDQVNNESGTIFGPATSFWQSFTAGKSGSLTGVGMVGWHSNPTTGYTLKIYSGEGTGGQLLYTQAVGNPYTSGNNVITSLPLSPGVAVTTGQKYTWEITNSSAFQLIGYPWASYVGGIGSQTTQQPGWGGMDFVFNTTVASSTDYTNDAPASFPLGNTTVTWTARDAAGNTATATQTVTVRDNINPTITAPAAVAATTNTNCTAMGVSLGTPTTADNCIIASVTNNAPTDFPLGETTVTWTVTGRQWQHGHGYADSERHG